MMLIKHFDIIIYNLSEIIIYNVEIHFYMSTKSICISKFITKFNNKYLCYNKLKIS